MKKYLFAAAAALALGGTAHANIVPDQDHAWVLIGLNWVNAVGLHTRSDVARDSGMSTEAETAVPMFQTRAECNATLRGILVQYRGASHAAGGGGYYLCAPLSA